MLIPLLGEMTWDTETDWLISQPIPVPVLGGILCTFSVEEYEDDPFPREFERAISNFLSLPHEVLLQAEEHIFRYYRDFREWVGVDAPEIPNIRSAQKVWSHLQLGTQPRVFRRPMGDEKIYISLECECNWEIEHGLEIVFKEGLQVNKVGSYDGHATNSDARNDPRFETMIYVGIDDR